MLPWTSRVPLVGGAPREILNDVEWADWSPDGTNVAVVHEVGARKRLEFPLGKVLYDADGWIGNPRVAPDGKSVAFVDHPQQGDDGGAVAVVDLAGGQMIEAAMIGREGVVGGLSALDSKISISRAIVQIAGDPQAHTLHFQALFGFRIIFNLDEIRRH